MLNQDAIHASGVNTSTPDATLMLPKKYQNDIFSGLPFYSSNSCKIAEYSELIGSPIKTVEIKLRERDLGYEFRKLIGQGEYEKFALLSAENKAAAAFLANGNKPVIVEDAMFFIKALGGFPADELKDLDNDRCREMLVSHAHERSLRPVSEYDTSSPEARVVVTLAICYDFTSKITETRQVTFDADISYDITGVGGFSWDTIIVPLTEENIMSRKTIAQMTQQEKNNCMRKALLDQLLTNPLPTQKLDL